MCESGTGAGSQQGPADLWRAEPVLKQVCRQNLGPDGLDGREGLCLKNCIPWKLDPYFISLWRTVAHDMDSLEKFVENFQSRGRTPLHQQQKETTMD